MSYFKILYYAFLYNSQAGHKSIQDAGVLKKNQIFAYFMNLKFP